MKFILLGIVAEYYRQQIKEEKKMSTNKLL